MAACLKHQKRMFVLLWMTLLLAVGGNYATSGKDKAIKATVGLCVVIPCEFPSAPGFSVGNAAWYKCGTTCRDSDKILTFNTTNSSPKNQSGIMGRVSLLEGDLTKKNCSIVIYKLDKSDSGSYQLRSLNGTKGLPYQETTVTVNDEKPKVKIHRVIDKQKTTLSCMAPHVCPGSAPKITWTISGPGANELSSKGKTTGNIRQSSTLTLNPSDIYHGMKATCKASFTEQMVVEETFTFDVPYLNKPKITGETTVNTGEALNLTCSVDSFPPSVVTWSKLGSNKTLSREKNATGSARLIIKNVKSEDDGTYICTAKTPNKTQEERVKVTVRNVSAVDLEILNSSECRRQLEDLTCVCISKGTPLPTIKWPLLDNHKNFSIISSMSSDRVSSTLTLAGKDNTAVQCVSSNKHGTHVAKNLTIKNVEGEKENEYMKLLRVAAKLEIIIAFLIGALLSAIICCLARRCRRKKERIYGDLAETLELVTSPEYQAIDANRPGAAEGEDMAAGKSDVNYSHLDFSRVKGKASAEVETSPETTETEYAEIKKAEVEARQAGEGQDEEEMIGEDEEVKESVADEKEGEDSALYSNVNDIMGEEEVKVSEEV